MPRPRTKPVKRQSRLNHHATHRAMITRFNPLRGLNPDNLSAYLDAFDQGYLTESVRMFEKIEERDNLLPGLVEKRKTAPTRRKWSIKKHEDSPRATQHAEELEYFYRNLTVTDATDGDFCGGFSDLVEQMMTAVGHKWAVHETVFQPSTEGLTGDFRFAPLWMFERTTGKLRFTDLFGDLTQRDLEPEGWMVTRGPGLMIPSAVGYMFKRLPLADFLAFCEKYSVTPAVGYTSAPKGSADWDAFHSSMVDFMSDLAAVFSTGDKIEFPSIPTGTLNPMQDLIEYVDKRAMQLWRGGDLSTQAGEGRGVGSERQDREAEILEANDLRRVTTTLQKQIDPLVIKYVFGTDETPLANIEMRIPEHRDVKGDIDTDAFFIERGIPLPISELYSRYNRRPPEDGEDQTTTEAVVGGEGTREMIEKHGSEGGGDQGKKADDAKEKDKGKKDGDQADDTDDDPELANEARPDVARETLVRNSVSEALQVLPGAMAELGDLFDALIGAAQSGHLENAELFEAADEAILRLPELLGGRSVDQLARVFEGAIFAAMTQGITLGNAYNPDQARYPAGHPKGGQWRPVDGGANPNDDNQRNEERRDKDPQRTGGDAGSGTPGQRTGGASGDDGSGSDRSGFALPASDAERFLNGIAATAKAHKFGAAVEVKDLAWYANPANDLYLSPDGLAGAAVSESGDLVSVFKHPDSNADMTAILTEAVTQSDALTADYFDIGGFLPDYYQRFGFVAAARVPFNREFAPPGWPYDEAGEPDIVLGVRDPDHILGRNRKWSDLRDSIPVFSDWGDAANEQARLLELIAGN